MTMVSLSQSMEMVNLSSDETTIPGTTTSAVTPADFDKEADFQQRFQDLPQELRDIIQDLTFPAHIAALGPRSCDVRDLAARARYGADLRILQLNRSTRKRYAADFYRLRTFSTRTSYITELGKCLRSIPEHHRIFIAEIVCIHPGLGRSTGCGCRRQRRIETEAMTKDFVRLKFGKEMRYKVRMDFEAAESSSLTQH